MQFLFYWKHREMSFSEFPGMVDWVSNSALLTCMEVRSLLEEILPSRELFLILRGT